MIVRLDFERDGQAVADVNDAGVLLPCTDEDFFGPSGKGFEQRARVFVTAMLAPHDREDAQLGIARHAAEETLDVGILLRREVVFGNQFGGDGGFGHLKMRLIGIKSVVNVGLTWFEFTREALALRNLFR